MSDRRKPTSMAPEATEFSLCGILNITTTACGGQRPKEKSVRRAPLTCTFLEPGSSSCQVRFAKTAEVPTFCEDAVPGLKAPLELVPIQPEDYESTESRFRRWRKAARREEKLQYGLFRTCCLIHDGRDLSESSANRPRHVSIRQVVMNTLKQLDRVHENAMARVSDESYIIKCEMKWEVNKALQAAKAVTGLNEASNESSAWDVYIRSIQKEALEALVTLFRSYIDAGDYGGASFAGFKKSRFAIDAALRLRGKLVMSETLDGKIELTSHWIPDEYFHRTKNTLLSPDDASVEELDTESMIEIDKVEDILL